MKIWTLKFLLAFAALAFGGSLAKPLVAQGAPPQSSAGQQYTIEYYYKCQWGHQQEFLDLFLKNHWPLLKKIESTGRIVSLKIESPAYHTTEDGRWDYRVTIIYKRLDRGHQLQSRRRSVHQAALAGPGDLSERRAAAVRDSPRPLGSAGNGDYAESSVTGIST